MKYSVRITNKRFKGSKIDFGYKDGEILVSVFRIDSRGKWKGLMMYAIMNMDNGKWLAGTEYYNGFQRPRESSQQMLTYAKLVDAKVDFAMRRCGPSYRIVSIKKPQFENVYRFDRRNGYDVDLSKWEDEDYD